MKNNIRIESNKYIIIQKIKEILNQMNNDITDLIGEDTCWHDYINKINNQLFDLAFYIQQED